MLSPAVPEDGKTKKRGTAALASARPARRAGAATLQRPGRAQSSPPYDVTEHPAARRHPCQGSRGASGKKGSFRERPDRQQPPRPRTRVPPRGGTALVGLGRLERPTSRLSGVRSNQLSYRPESHPGSRPRQPPPMPEGKAGGPVSIHRSRAHEGTCRRRRRLEGPGAPLKAIARGARHLTGRL